MGIFNKIFNNEEEKEKRSLSDVNSYFEMTGKKIEEVDDIQEITYYTCLKVLSESMGKLSIHLKDGEGNKVYKNNSLQRLRTRPNPYMSPSTFKTLMEYNRNHYGNAYAWLKFDKVGQLIGLYPLKPLNMKILLDDENILESDGYVYEYQIPNSSKVVHFSDKEILHLKGGLSNDGLVGKSVRETLYTSFSGAKKSQQFLNELYENGLNANAVIKYTGDLNREKKQKLVDELKSFSSSGAERFIPLPFGMDITPLDLKLTDSQFYELKKYSALQIAAAFGIKPNHLNDYEKSSYANSEMQNLTFYVDTLLYIITLYEEEFNFKMLSEDERLKGYHFEINVASILRGDIKTQAESISRLVQSSVYRINEARDYLGMPRIDEGDTIMVNGSYVKLEEIGKAYDRYSNKNNVKEGGDEEDDRDKERDE